MFLDTMCNCCKTALDVTIPEQIVNIIHLVYRAIQIGVPLILIIIGMIDLAKSITQQKEDDIKKAQQLLIKKGITAAIIFLMFSLVNLLFTLVGNSTKGDGMWDCISSLINGECNGTVVVDDDDEHVVIDEEKQERINYCNLLTEDECKNNRDVCMLKGNTCIAR